MQKQNLCQGDFMPKNRQHYRKIKYPDKVTKQKRLVFVRIFLFSSVGSRNAYFPTAPYCLKYFILLLFDALLTFLMPGFEKTVHSCFKDRVKPRFLRTNFTY